MKRTFTRMYDRFTGKPERAFYKLRDDYAETCLKLEYQICEKEEEVSRLRQIFIEIDNTTEDSHIKELVEEALHEQRV